MKSKRPTMSDVARMAGVSKATVSAVINDGVSVSDGTRARVLDVIAHLGYQPGGPDRHRGGEQSRIIGLIVREIENPYYAEMIASARKHASASGYSLLIASSEGDHEAERRIVNALRVRDVAGLLINPMLTDDTDLSHLFELKRRNIPFVLLEEIRGVQASLVDVDNTEAVRKAVRYLITEGHTRIVHFAGPRYSTHSEQRLEGVRRAYSESSLIFTEEMVIPAGASSEDGYRAGMAYFREIGEKRPTAVLCYNDLVALGLLRALSELGIRVPDEVSIVGIDDIEPLSYASIPLTTIPIPKRRMAELGVQLLIRQIESKKPLPPEKIFLETELIVRASTRSLRTDPTPARTTLPRRKQRVGS